MNRWSKIVLAIAVAGLAAWVATGVQGRGVAEMREALALHTLAGFVATLVLILADGWVAVFLVACERGLRRSGLAADDRLEPLARARRHTTALAICAAAATLGQLTLSGLFYPGRLPRWSHLGLALLALGLQVALWLSARRSLTLQHAICSQLEPTA